MCAGWEQQIHSSCLSAAAEADTEADVGVEEGEWGYEQKLLTLQLKAAACTPQHTKEDARVSQGINMLPCYLMHSAKWIQGQYCVSEHASSYGTVLLYWTS